MSQLCTTLWYIAIVTGIANANKHAGITLRPAVFPLYSLCSLKPFHKHMHVNENFCAQISAAQPLDAHRPVLLLFSLFICIYMLYCMIF